MLRLMTQRCVMGEANCRKIRMRKRIEGFYGKKSRKTRKMLTTLNNIVKKMKTKIREKHRIKVGHLVRKFKSEGAKRVENPELIKRYRNVGIFEGERNLEREVLLEYEDCEVVIVELSDEIGSIVMNDDEKALLGMPPKTQIVDKLTTEMFEVDLGIAASKFRWELKKRDDEKLEDEEPEDMNSKNKEEDKLIYEEMEAKSRMIFNPIEGNLDLSKRRATDVPGNTKTYLPKAALEKVGRSDKARRTTNGSSQFRQSSSDNQWE